MMIDYFFLGSIIFFVSFVVRVMAESLMERIWGMVATLLAVCAGFALIMTVLDKMDILARLGA